MLRIELTVDDLEAAKAQLLPYFDPTATHPPATGMMRDALANLRQDPDGSLTTKVGPFSGRLSLAKDGEG